MNSVNYNELITEATSQPVCDFCHRPNVTWRYPAQDFIVPELQWISRGDWAACDKCAGFIESGKLDDLAFLISGILSLSHPDAENMAGSDKDRFHIIHYYWLRPTFRQFAANRTGERVKA